MYRYKKDLERNRAKQMYQYKKDLQNNRAKKRICYLKNIKQERDRQKKNCDCKWLYNKQYYEKKS